MKKTFFDKVARFSNDQLLVKSFTNQIQGQTANTFRFVAPVGRGEAVGFQVHIITDFRASISQQVFSVKINGKAINTDLPVVNFRDALSFSDGGWNGTTLIVKTTVPIPEGATIEVFINVPFNIAESNLVFDLYYTDVFIPLQTKTSFTQAFKNSTPNLSSNTEEFVISTGRGKVVGISLVIDGESGEMNRGIALCTISINGISILEDINPVKYFPHSIARQANNWGMMADGGGIIKISIDNNIDTTVHFFTTLYFSTDKVLG